MVRSKDTNKRLHAAAPKMHEMLKQVAEYLNANVWRHHGTPEYGSIRQMEDEILKILISLEEE